MLDGSWFSDCKIEPHHVLLLGNKSVIIDTRGHCVLDVISASAKRIAVDLGKARRLIRVCDWPPVPSQATLQHCLSPRFFLGFDNQKDVTSTT